jgi:hypothetical protein
VILNEKTHCFIARQIESPFTSVEERQPKPSGVRLTAPGGSTILRVRFAYREAHTQSEHYRTKAYARTGAPKNSISKTWSVIVPRAAWGAANDFRSSGPARHRA